MPTASDVPAAAAHTGTAAATISRPRRLALLIGMPPWWLTTLSNRAACVAPLTGQRAARGFTMFAMTFTDWTGVPADVAAARAESEAEIAGSTLLTEFAETAAQVPDVVAHRWQAGDQWRSLTYRQLHDQVRDAALGLAAAGLRPGGLGAGWSRNRAGAAVAEHGVG